MRHGGDGAQGHQDNRDDDGSQGDKSAGELPELRNQLLVGLADLAAVRLVTGFHLRPDVFGEEIADNQGRQGHQNAHAHH